MENKYNINNKKLTKMICDYLGIENVKELKNLTMEQKEKFYILIDEVKTIIELNESAKLLETKIYPIYADEK